MGPEVVVAVCTNRAPEAAAEALSALGLQVPEARLAVVANGVRAAPFRDRFGIQVLEEQRRGLSHARNRALAWAPGDAVLAFVDDDAIVDPGWYPALCEAWERAAPHVGCIGGPIRPRWPPAGPPAYVSQPILATLTLLDLGPEERQLDPEVTTVFGANISFRVAPLRQAGGFDPAFGHAGSRVSFSEEDEAQRALARLGFRTIYTPAAGVRHAISPDRLTRGSFIRRRFAYGVVLARRGARTRRRALRQMLSSAAGAFAAGLTGDDRLFMERAVRAAENAGVLAGRRR